MGTDALPFRNRILALAGELLAAAGQAGADARVAVTAPGLRIDLAVGALCEGGPELAGGPAPGGARLRRIHRRLLAAATDAPIPAKQLATKAGYRRCHSHVRQALTELVRWELLRHTPDGYRLP